MPAYFNRIILTSKKINDSSQTKFEYPLNFFYHSQRLISLPVISQKNQIAIYKRVKHMREFTKTEPAQQTTISLEVNGEPHKIVVQPQWTLQYVLQDKLGLTGTKEFCAEGACGACAVIIDGRPILSCMTLAIECDNQAIETIEGITRANHPLIEAYIKYSCMQCGFCTPGFIVTAKALLDRNPDPTVEEIKEALVGNLCRCGTYPQHIKAILEAAKQLRGGKNRA
jgi:aerobic-type carbon monoxide dehydrogenase small subunit (CoxS/CutS family)